jgi:hypothetical protein
MRCVLQKSGTRMSAARTALCTKMEMAKARRRTLRSRRRCSASPSTRHPHNDPRFSSWSASEAFLGSGDITHLHTFSCKRPPLHGLYNGATENFFRRRFPGGCSRSPGDRRRARRDVRLRASSLLWTPSLGTSSQGLLEGTACVNAKKCPGAAGFDNNLFILNKLRLPYPSAPFAHLIFLWTWILGGMPRWTGTI